MSDHDFGCTKPMPVTGGCCGIRPSKEAMEVDFGVDFSYARTLLEKQQKDIQTDVSHQSQQTNHQVK